MKPYKLMLLSVMISGCLSPQPALVLEEERGIAATPPAASGTATLPVVNEQKVAVREAVDRALPFLEREGTAWMEGRVSVQGGHGCVSCHHVGYALWSHAEARRVGIDTLAPAFQDLAGAAITFLDRPEIPRALSAGHVMLAEPKQAAVLRQHMLELQNTGGDWSAKGQFPTQRRPIAESDAVATMYALLALREVGAGEGTPDPEKHAKALAWLAEQPTGESTEWLAWRLVLAHHLGEDVGPLRQSLLGRQGQDGGWGWLDGADSDAFSTGQALYALSLTAGEQTADAPAKAAIEHARRFLIASQGDDGSWQTASGVISDEPSEEKDVIYHFWGTAWAAIGLARSLDA